MSRRRTADMHRASALFSKLVKARDQHCQRCGSVGRLEAAHILSRSWQSIRCDLDNAIALCSEHHAYYTLRPREWREWIEEQYPGRWERLRERALRYERINWKDKLAELREMEVAS